MSGLSLFQNQKLQLLRLLILIFFIFPSIGRAEEEPKNEEEIQKNIQIVLEQRHPVDTPKWWRSLGSQAPKVIISMYETTDSTYQRIRLVQGLSWFDDSTATEFLKKQIQTNKESIIKRAAIKTIGLSQGEKEIDFIAEFLKNPDPPMRLAAAQTLQRMEKELSSAKAKTLLDQFKTEEKTPWLLTRMEEQYPAPPTSQKIKPLITAKSRLTVELSGQWNGY